VIDHTREIDLNLINDGHLPLLVSSNDGDVCIDLSTMQEIEVNTESRTINVLGGATWGIIHAASQKYGLGLPGCSCSQVSIGGLTLVGGYGPLSGTHGFAPIIF
jgi:FAD/FMN-containing dehydrogenase